MAHTHQFNKSLTKFSDLSDTQALQLFEMDDIQVVESKPLLVDGELPVRILKNEGKEGKRHISSDAE